MAIKQDTVVAIRKGGDKLVIGHLDPSKYATQTFSTNPQQEVDTGNHTWANYFMCAYKGVFEHLVSKGEQQPQLTGLQILVEGRVPLGSGLSSSAALVCSASLAILAAYQLNASSQEVATFTASCEKYVGTESGGMDQAISIMGAPGIAKLVQFNPVRASNVVLPKSATFVVANSLTVSNKAETGDGRYNLRVVECRLAAAVLALALGHSKEEARKIVTLKEVEPLIERQLSGPKGSVEGAAAAAVESHLHTEAYQEAELQDLLGVELTSIFKGNKSQLRSVEYAKKNGGFKLRQRALHVYAEALRVPLFQKACNEGGSEAEKLEKIGKLMDESQASCRDLYDCSCPELDEVIRQAKEYGALGSRLTGAGWGGCTVSLIKQDQAAEFIGKLKDNYFAQCVKDGKVTADGLDDVVFDSRPSSGGAVLRLKL
jgi:N-acetylgalactosamine kinase